MFEPAPRLRGLAVAAPGVSVAQDEMKAFAARLFGPSVTPLLPVFDHAGIRTRRTCVPLEWLAQPHGFAERNRLFIEHAVPLLERLTNEALDRAGVRADELDALVVASSTGVCTPTLDALLMERMHLPRSLRRLPIFGLGCGAGVVGLARAAALARERPDRAVLFLTVELCSLTFRADDRSKSNLVATALFADGAAAAVLCCQGDGPRFVASVEHTFPDSLEVMGWHVEDDGFGVLFSKDIPTIVRRDLAPILDRFLEHVDVDPRSILRHAIHPGGTKVLLALESVLGLEHGGLADARAVLSEFGNMSAPTVLFVLRRILDRDSGVLPGPCLFSALGPGFTAAMGLFEA